MIAYYGLASKTIKEKLSNYGHNTNVLLKISIIQILDKIFSQNFLAMSASYINKLVINKLFWLY